MQNCIINNQNAFVSADIDLKSNAAETDIH